MCKLAADLCRFSFFYVFNRNLIEKVSVQTVVQTVGWIHSDGHTEHILNI